MSRQEKRKTRYNLKRIVIEAVRQSKRDPSQERSNDAKSTLSSATVTLSEVSRPTSSAAVGPPPNDNQANRSKKSGENGIEQTAASATAPAFRLKAIDVSPTATKRSDIALRPSAAKRSSMQPPTILEPKHKDLSTAFSGMSAYHRPGYPVHHPRHAVAAPYSYNPYYGQRPPPPPPPTVPVHHHPGYDPGHYPRPHAAVAPYNYSPYYGQRQREQPPPPPAKERQQSRGAPCPPTQNDKTNAVRKVAPRPPESDARKKPAPISVSASAVPGSENTKPQARSDRSRREGKFGPLLPTSVYMEPNGKWVCTV